MKQLIARHDGTTSRTKTTNILAILSAVIVAIPAVQVLLPGWVYSVLLAGFAAAQQYFRDSQSSL